MIDGFAIVRMREDDIADVLHLAELGGLSRWSDKDYLAEIARQDSATLVARDLVNDVLAGFIVARLIMNNDTSSSDVSYPPHAEILNITIKESYRKKGIGSALIREALLTSPENTPIAVWLEVRCSNTGAIRFYEKLGFVCEYTRKGLYSEPPEDGFVMKMDVADLF